MGRAQEDIRKFLSKKEYDLFINLMKPYFLNRKKYSVEDAIGSAVHMSEIYDSRKKKVWRFINKLQEYITWGRR